MMVGHAETVAAWREVLGLCRLRSDETVAILTKPEANVRNVEAAKHAVIDLGAQHFCLEPHIGRAPLRANAPAMAALSSVGLIIDFLGIHLLRGGEQHALLQAGTRILYAIEPPETLIRLMPTAEDKQRVKAAEACLQAASTMTVTSRAGTDLTVSIGEYPILCEYGYSDEPGHWDHWGAGFVATWPDEGSARGTVVIDRGDIVFPFKSYVQTPVRLSIEKGLIREIEGDLDAEFLREYMREFRDEEAYAVSHLGWGLQPRARWTALGLLDKAQTNGNDGRAFYGNFMFSTGPNTDAGGRRDTRCHLDVPMRRCSVSLDGRPMTVDGDVVADGQRVGRGE
jgi:2,5-dihydroxypyridine 5,6-dioxygenase